MTHTMNAEIQLFGTFAKPQTSDWVKAASAEIKGADPFETLKWTSPEGLEFKPYYSQDDIAQLKYLKRFEFQAERSNYGYARSWQNVPFVSVHDETSANAVALDHLKHGADGLLFSMEKNSVDFDKLLNAIEWPHCSVSFHASNDFPVADLEEYIDRKKYDLKTLSGAIFRKELTINSISLRPESKFKKLGVHITPSSPVDEIASALSKAVQLTGYFQKKGCPVHHVLNAIAFSLPVGSQLLLEISKLKALRMLWFQITQAYGMSDYKPDALYLHARSEPWINENFQPHGNLLKSTIASMASIAGGCNALTVIPEFETNSTTNRMARNLSAILQEESHFDKVSDPFAGSYAVEVFVDELSRLAWKKFQSLIA